jgi:hypothetical protein
VPLTEAAFPKMGVRVDEQLRVLVCEGPSLLGWVGGFRREPYAHRDKALLRAIVPALRRRMTLERTLATAAHMHAALEAALDAIPSPAFVVTASGVPSLANAAGRAAIDADRATWRTKLREAQTARRGARSCAKLRDTRPRASSSR